MTKPPTERQSTADRLKADRLRAIKASLRSLGKRGLGDVFAAGEVLEKAASLHDGMFSAWVKSECGIEPRTALGYRRTFLVLGDRKGWLADRNVSPSVAVTIAAATPEGRAGAGRDRFRPLALRGRREGDRPRRAAADGGCPGAPGRASPDHAGVLLGLRRGGRAHRLAGRRRRSHGRNPPRGVGRARPCGAADRFGTRHASRRRRTREAEPPRSSRLRARRGLRRGGHLRGRMPHVGPGNLDAGRRRAD